MTGFGTWGGTFGPDSDGADSGDAGLDNAGRDEMACQMTGQVTVPVEDRCWCCDRSPIAEDSRDKAGLCEACRDKLRKTPAA